MRASVHRLIQHTANRLRKSIDRDRRLLIFFLGPFSKEMEVCWPLENVPELSNPTMRLVEMCFKRERSITVFDAKVDPLIGTVEGADFRSAQCVPLFDKDKNPMGVIYIDGQEVGLFDKASQLETERVSRSLSARVPSWSDASKEIDAEPPEQSQFSLNGLLVTGGILSAFVLMWLFAPATPGETRPPVVPLKAKVKQHDPDTTVNTLLMLLNLGRIEEVYALFVPEFQKKTDYEEFYKKTRQWLSEDGNRWQLPRRKVRLGSRDDDKAVVYIDPPQELRDKMQMWSVRLQYDGDRWLISEVRGGPF